MSRQEHILTVFVASPGDVEEERGRLEDVIRELNVAWSRELGVRFELVRWETHAYPGMGMDAQAVINEQIPDDFDLFVGIMWCRYGTPTGRAGSGTVEEFKRAKARHDADPSCVKLMVYFKDEPLSPSLLDPSQLAKVNEFRDSLGEEGALHWKFSGIDQFEKLIRLHLTRQVQAWRKEVDRSDTSVKSLPVEVSDADREAEEEGVDLGILDLMEIFEDRFGDLTNMTERMGKATKDLNQKMRDRTTEMNKLPRDSQGNANRKDAKRLIAKFSSDMEQYTARVEAELPLFNDALNTGLSSLIRAVTMTVDLKSDDADMEQAQEALDAVVTLRGVLATTKESMSDFRTGVAGLPRMTTDLNRAKRGVAGALSKLLEGLTNGETLSGEAEKVLRELLGE